MQGIARGIACAFLALALSGPTVAQTCAGFTDVPADNQFCAEIGWIKNRGITLGCNPGGTAYCPSSFVTRDQMAAFMNRLANALSPAQVVWVAKSGGHFTGVQAALDSITDASAAKRYLVKIAPGEYVGKVTLKSYVDLEGSGQRATVLTSAGTSENPNVGDSSATLRAGTVVAEVRSLTVAATGPAQFVTAIRTTGSSGDLVFRDLTVEASAGTSWTAGIFNNAGSPTIRDLTVNLSGGATPSAFGAGVWNETSSPAVTNVNVNANMGTGLAGYGMYNYGSSPTVVGGLFSAGGQSAFGMINLAGSSPRVRGTRFVAIGGTGTAYGVLNDGVGTSAMYDGIDASGFVAPESGGMKTDNGARALVSNSFLGGTFSAYTVGTGAVTQLFSTLVSHTVYQVSGGDNLCVNMAALNGVNSLTTLGC